MEVKIMVQRLILFLLTGASVTGCATLNETMRAMECNKQAIDMSTCVIMENARAIEETNAKIEENKRQLEAINEALKNVSGG